MKPNLLTADSFTPLTWNSIPFPRNSIPHPNHFLSITSPYPNSSRPSRLIPIFPSSNPTKKQSNSSNEEVSLNSNVEVLGEDELVRNLNVQVGNPIVPSYIQSWTKDEGRSSPNPESLAPQFRRNMKLRASNFNKDRSGKIVYADHAISKWFAVGLDDNDQFPPYVHLEPISFEVVVRKNVEKPLVLVNSPVTEEHKHISVPRVWSALKGVNRCTFLMNLGHLIGITLIQSHSMSLESVNKIQVEEAILRQLKRSFYTNIPSSYMENITDGVVPVIGVDFEEEKDIYDVNLSDNTQPDATVSCKCSVTENKKLLLYKAGFVQARVELNQVRQMVVDISCLDKNLDLRLMLCTKRILTTLTDDEMNSIRDLINSAVLDSDTKGGLRWPLGKASSGGRYSVIGVWHTIAKAYQSSSFRLKEVGAESDSISIMLEDSLKLIWDKFLCYGLSVVYENEESLEVLAILAHEDTIVALLLIVVLLNLP
ncbi:unnamed protein product [Dovyalis caffra]|uniref:DUF7903 domain-containing protein n=1 Tax=Dovyalis caffra TaxID=77055 RepID=A0AAV1RXR5_9ROSI|nr:unnamed protein product [Dovyalis caffra]